MAHTKPAAQQTAQQPTQTALPVVGQRQKALLAKLASTRSKRATELKAQRLLRQRLRTTGHNARDAQAQHAASVAAYTAAGHVVRGTVGAAGSTTTALQQGPAKGTVLATAQAHVNTLPAGSYTANDVLAQLGWPIGPRRPKVRAALAARAVQVLAGAGNTKLFVLP